MESSWICQIRDINDCNISYEKIKQLKEFFSLLADCNRIKILCLLVKNWKMCVCEIERVLKIKQNLVSHHLNLLRKFWLVDYEKKWRSVYYFINLFKYRLFQEELKVLIPNLK